MDADAVAATARKQCRTCSVCVLLCAVAAVVMFVLVASGKMFACESCRVYVCQAVDMTGVPELSDRHVAWCRGSTRAGFFHGLAVDNMTNTPSTYYAVDCQLLASQPGSTHVHVMPSINASMLENAGNIDGIGAGAVYVVAEKTIDVVLTTYLLTRVLNDTGTVLPSTYCVASSEAMFLRKNRLAFFITPSIVLIGLLVPILALLLWRYRQTGKSSTFLPRANM